MKNWGKKWSWGVDSDFRFPLYAPHWCCIFNVNNVLFLLSYEILSFIFKIVLFSLNFQSLNTPYIYLCLNPVYIYQIYSKFYRLYSISLLLWQAKLIALDKRIKRDMTNYCCKPLRHVYRNYWNNFALLVPECCFLSNPKGPCQPGWLGKSRWIAQADGTWQNRPPVPLFNTPALEESVV